MKENLRKIVVFSNVQNEIRFKCTCQSIRYFDWDFFACHALLHNAYPMHSKEKTETTISGSNSKNKKTAKVCLHDRVASPSFSQCSFRERRMHVPNAEGFSRSSRFFRIRLPCVPLQHVFPVFLMSQMQNEQCHKSD
jgi:hypothetical protein